MCKNTTPARDGTNFLSIAGIDCRACHSSGPFFLCDTHTHTHTHTHTLSEVFVSTDARRALPSWCYRQHGGRVSKRYRFESRRGQWALFSLIPSALSFVFLWHTHTHTHTLCLPFVWHFLVIVIHTHTHTHTLAHSRTHVRTRVYEPLNLLPICTHVRAAISAVYFG